MPSGTGLVNKNKTVALIAPNQAVRRYLEEAVRHCGYAVATEKDAVVRIYADGPDTENGGVRVASGDDGEGIRLALPLRLENIAASLVKAAHAAGREDSAFGPYRIDHIEKIVTKDGVDMRLTEKEFAIIDALAEAKGNPVSRQDLLADVWAYARDAETHTIETHIYRLRQKIENDPANPEWIITTDNGYCLNFMG